MKSFITILLILCFSSLYSQVLNLYGYTDGKNYDTYLGCINCNQLDKNSINNTNGVYGSKFSHNLLLEGHNKRYKRQYF